MRSGMMVTHHRSHHEHHHQNYVLSSLLPGEDIPPRIKGGAAGLDEDSYD
jgi:hypothetical protein